MHKLLFVCLGNICRSPTAEGVMRQLVREAGKEGEFFLDSAGTGSWHLGQAPDERAQAACCAVGIDISAHRARQVTREDFMRFDRILACDKENYRDLCALRPENAKTQVALLMRYAGDPDGEVPDPYYGGAEGFAHVVKLVRGACEGLLASFGKEKA